MKRSLLVATLAVMLLGSCGGTSDPAAAPLPTTSASQLAQRLVAAKDLETAVAITREVLARGGVPTIDGDRVLVEAIGPASAFRSTPLETLHLAMEARQRPHAGRLTAAEFAQMLEGFGWPFRDAQPDRPADRPFEGRLPDDLAKIARDGPAHDGTAREAQETPEAVIEAERLAASEREQALMLRLQGATLAWQEAKQAAANAAGPDKPVADARVKAAQDVRKELGQQLRLEKRQNSDSLRETRRVAFKRDQNAKQDAYRLQQVLARVGPDYAAGEQLMALLSAWVSEAKKDPDDPRNFTPLFLAEMARLQDAPVDITGSRFSRPGRGAGAPVDLRGPPRSEQLRLTLLELQLIAAAFHRAPNVQTTVAIRDVARDRAITSVVDLLVPPAMAASQTPCSDFRKDLRRQAGSLVGEAAIAGASEALGEALGAAAGFGPDSAANAEALGKMMGSLGIAAKVLKLVAFYADTQVSVVGTPDKTHKPPTGTPVLTFTAMAGVDEKDLEEFERLNADQANKAQRDCYTTLGLPTLPNISDLASEAENWVVEWRLVEGGPNHAEFAPLEFNPLEKGYFGVLGMRLKRTSQHAASARLFVVLFSERGHKGTLVRTPVSARASVNAAGTPSLGTWINAMKGGLGLADALVELAAGWTQSMVKPRAYATVEVEYHCPNPSTLHETANAVADGPVDDGPNSCLLAAR